MRYFAIAPRASSHNDFTPLTRLSRALRLRFAFPGSSGETYYRHKDGTVFPIWENVTVVRDEGGAAGHYVVAFSDISAMRRAEAQLNHLTHHDPLTGLPNRLLFNDRLDQTLARAQREEGRCAILFLDLDGFKVINDTLGHSSGDLLLQTIAARLKRGLRSNDTAARLGGDEFVVLLDHIANHFEDIVHEALAESGLPASLLEIEITESTLQRIEHSRHLVDTLKALGVSIAIDDFGTGYSSLSVIKHLPIDRLKIDQFFVRDIPGDAGDVAIVEAIVSLSRTLGLRVIAEGVETEAQLAVLRRLGCEEGQGYLFSRPLPLLQNLSSGERPWAQLPWG